MVFYLLLHHTFLTRIYWLSLVGLSFVLTFHFRFIVILRRMELPKKYEDYEAYSKGALETRIHGAAAHSYVLLYARVIAPVNSIQPAVSL